MNPFDQFLLKTKRIVRRRIGTTIKSFRPSSSPFLSGDTFRAIAQHIYDELSDIDPKEVHESDIVFVRRNLIEEFFQKIHPHITEKYILITHNDDPNITDELTKYIDEKVIVWFAHNVLAKHPKLIPIPTGLENQHYKRIGLISNFVKIRKTAEFAQMRNGKIGYAFNAGAHPDRAIALGILKNTPHAENIFTKGHEAYFKKVLSYSFLICPYGVGIDCHKMWEAQYLGLIPITLRNTSTSHFESIGLPIILLDSWSDLKTLSKEFLEKKESEFRYNDRKAIWLSYWIDTIKAYQDGIKR